MVLIVEFVREGLILFIQRSEFEVLLKLLEEEKYFEKACQLHCQSRNRQ